MATPAQPDLPNAHHRPFCCSFLTLISSGNTDPSKRIMNFITFAAQQPPYPALPVPGTNTTNLRDYYYMIRLTQIREPSHNPVEGAIPTPGWDFTGARRRMYVTTCHPVQEVEPKFFDATYGDVNGPLIKSWGNQAFRFVRKKLWLERLGCIGCGIAYSIEVGVPPEEADGDWESESDGEFDWSEDGTLRICCKVCHVSKVRCGQCQNCGLTDRDDNEAQRDSASNKSNEGDESREPERAEPENNEPENDETQSEDNDATQSEDNDATQSEDNDETQSEDNDETQSEDNDESDEESNSDQAPPQRARRCIDGVRESDEENAEVIRSIERRHREDDYRPSLYKRRKL